MCIECNGNYPSCPVCDETPEKDMKECPDCKGWGKIGYDMDGETVEYNSQFNKGGWDFCITCDGMGRVEDDN